MSQAVSQRLNLSHFLLFLLLALLTSACTVGPEAFGNTYWDKPTGVVFKKLAGYSFISGSDEQVGWSAAMHGSSGEYPLVVLKIPPDDYSEYSLDQIARSFVPLEQKEKCTQPARTSLMGWKALVVQCTVPDQGITGSFILAKMPDARLLEVLGVSKTKDWGAFQRLFRAFVKTLSYFPPGPQYKQ